MDLADLAARFWPRVDRSGGPDACWPWQGAPRNGYGMIQVDGRPMGTHRVAFMLAIGPIPADRPMVLHECDNRPCCNWRHLYAGTHADNMRDSVERERHRYGEAHPKATLTAADMDAIRSSASTQRVLAERFGVSQSSIWRVMHGVTRQRG